MKKDRLSNPVIPDYTPRGQKKVEEPVLAPRTCLVCQKLTAGYAVWRCGYTCSRKCTTDYSEAKPSLIDHVIGAES